MVEENWKYVCFKQKTAYEMLISDWSSDVCSSDLTQGGPDRAGVAYFRTVLVEVPDAADVGEDEGTHAQIDRKSVVSGKSVSVRVDLGGSCIINKKTTAIIINIIILYHPNTNISTHDFVIIEHNHDVSLKIY